MIPPQLKYVIFQTITLPESNVSDNDQIFKLALTENTEGYDCLIGFPYFIPAPCDDPVSTTQQPSMSCKYIASKDIVYTA